MDRVLLDTDVIMDFFFNREPFAEFAIEVLNRCEEGKIKGFITPVIICNVYYLLRKTAQHQLIIEKIKQLLSIIDIVQMDKEVVLDALNSEFNDFEDALQNYAAIQNSTLNIILTRNIKDFKKSDLGVFTPETYLKLNTSD
ncbi:PIN domain-containing protein [Psychroflexus planctonicus]|uniref:PIN domain-containing protein n=1 Tax=Psychroflexus planctonicus TaxID=1526575 RepID=A0ABQ1SBQ3_9FLAO|nr:PIN domain-containing protein [Psychroflexus planctonicus]GGE25792.1 PIN domain-containing protein [Psychroflexus planctonicus]